MTKAQAKERLEKFMGDEAFTFTIKKYPGDRWVAQCNEVDGIITGGTGYDLAYMEELIQDAILTAACIPAELSEGLLKRVMSKEPIRPVTDEIDSSTNLTVLQSAYTIGDYATVGQLSTR